MHLSKKSYIIVGSAIFILLLIFIIKIASGDSLKRQTPKPVVVIGKLIKGDIQSTESLTGDILPIQQASIFSKVNGTIEKNYVDIGTRVSNNQILALIDTTIYSQNAKQAKANYMQAMANNLNSKLNYERNKKLLEQKLVAQQDLDNAKAASDIALAQLEAAEAVYNNAATQLSYCKITAPFQGTITKRNFDPGSYITATTNAQGSVLFMLMNIDRLKTIVNVPERNVSYLSSVKEVIVTVDAIPNKKFGAKISKISQAIDLASRTMAVEIEIVNSGSLLKPGMFATVQFVTEKKSNSNIIPNQIVLNDEKGDFVYALNSDTSVSKRYIKIGIRTDDKLEILSGLDETDRIVFVGQTLIKDKMKVKIAK
ncbi:MAG: efflux RND transporter periplasmic adaptor subunit [Ignavibacteriales bacterium]|nr:efflux RND transporter periplasmic adaptor subunit [Ignavibacteriales bacterium]